VANLEDQCHRLTTALLDEATLDPRAFAEPVDVVPKLSPSLHTDLKSSKWKERKEALDGLSAIFSSTPRIKDAPELAEIVRSLAARVASDANINCVMVAAKCIEDVFSTVSHSIPIDHNSI
jgi:cytoskeleton-associated protein 5